MLDQLTAFIRDLRRAGLPVSLTEEVDAAKALQVADLMSVVSFRETLRCTLAKSRTAQYGFDPIFDAYFGPRSTKPPGDAPPLSEDAVLAALEGHAVLSDVAKAVVDAHAAMEPGRPVGVRYHVLQAMASLERDALFARLLRDDDEQDALARLASRSDLEARWRSLEQEIEREVQRRVADVHGIDSAITEARRRQSYNIEFARATESEIAELRANLAPLARRLAIKLGRKRRHSRKGGLDFRNTMRHSLSYGGSTIELRFKRSVPAKPQLLVLADISGSVASFSRFTMQLVYALDKEFRGLRTFAFIDSIDDVTQLLAGQDRFEKALARVAERAEVLWRDGNSDYGHALTQFWDEHNSVVNARTTVLVLGDARTNYHPPHPEALRSIQRAGRKVLWLNPEPQAYWGAGDSAMSEYAQYCDKVVECRNLRQLAKALEFIA